jgi:transposase InsO family protein
VLGLLTAIAGALRATFRPRASLVAENLALRQQLAVLQQKTKRPRLSPVDRAFWVALSRVWSRWAEALTIVKPETVIGWHRRGFARFWTWKSKRVGRPPLAPDIVELIVRLAKDNPTWRRRRIAMELAKLGHRVDKNSVAKYMPKRGGRPGRPSQTWGTFIRNHIAGTLAIDFFTIPTVTFDVLHVVIVLSLERRLILHVNVTAYPYAEWAAQQIVEAFGADGAFKLLIRDRDRIFGAAFDRRVENLGVRQLRIAPRSPWQNGYAERLVGTFRHELTDHLIVLNERHLLRTVREYANFYNSDKAAHVARRRRAEREKRRAAPVREGRRATPSRRSPAPLCQEGGVTIDDFFTNTRPHSRSGRRIP